METEKKMATVFTDIVEPNQVKLDFIKCCEFFVKTNKFVLGDEIKTSQLWSLPSTTDRIIPNEANREIIRNAFQALCNYEKKYSGLGNFFLTLVSQDYKYARSKKTRMSSASILRHVSKSVDCYYTDVVLKNIRKHGNPQLSVSVVREPLVRPSIKFKTNPTVRLRVSPSFTQVRGDFKNCKFFMVNGAVSKPSEIMKLLNASFESKNVTYFLLCRSFNSDVVFTLKENYDRGITNVIPLEFGFDIDSINSIADLVSLVGGLPMSADLGDVLSAYDESRLGLSDSVNIQQDYVTVAPSHDPSAHINKLYSQIDLAEDEKRKLLAKRLIALKGNACEVKLPTSSEWNNVEVNIRHATKIFSDMTKKGTVVMTCGNNKFYIPAHDDTIIEKLIDDVENLLDTKLFLPRRIK